MKELIRSTSEFQAIEEHNNVIAQLKLIRASTVVDQRSQHPALNVLQALHKFASFRQMNLRNDVYLEGFRDRVSIYEDITGEMIGCDIRRAEEELGGSIRKVSYDDPALIAAKNKCRDKFLAIACIEHADKKRYSELQTSLSNDYLRKKADEYPQTLIHAAEILNKWKVSESRGRIPGYSPMFLQQGEGHEGRGTDRRRGRRGGRGSTIRDSSSGSNSKPINVNSASVNP
jgi:hypothetical protein